MHDLVLKRAKLQFVPYDLRHTAATRWAEGGIDIATIAAWLGHANLRSVQKYIHPSHEHLNAQAEKFEQQWVSRAEADTVEGTHKLTLLWHSPPAPCTVLLAPLRLVVHFLKLRDAPIRQWPSRVSSEFSFLHAVSHAIRCWRLPTAGPSEGSLIS